MLGVGASVKTLLPPFRLSRCRVAVFLRVNDGLRDSRGMLQEFDGVAEVWFESEQELIDAMSSPEGQEVSAILLQDESKFLDHARSTAFIAQEHVL